MDKKTEDPADVCGEDGITPEGSSFGVELTRPYSSQREGVCPEFPSR